MKTVYAVISTVQRGYRKKLKVRCAMRKGTQTLHYSQLVDTRPQAIAFIEVVTR